MASTTYRNEITKNGHKFDVAKSGLQKYIRRRISEKAIYFADDIDHFRGMEGGGRLITNFENRIRIIALEDICLANPYLPILIDEILDNYEKNKLFSLINTMSLSYHSRYYSHLRAFYNNKPCKFYYEPKLLTFDLGKDEDLRDYVNSLIYCLEKRNTKAWYFAMKILEREKLKDKWYKSTRPGFLIFSILDEFMVNENHKKILKVCMKWYSHMKMREQFLCVMHPIFVYIYDIDEDIPGLVNWNEKIPEKIIVDDYVYDQHTKIGKRLGRNAIDFGVGGSLVALDTFKNEKLEKNYIQGKINLDLDKISSEKKEFSNVIRSQLNTGSSKQDVYFATDRIGNRVVVKGPYSTFEEVKFIFDLQNIFKLFKYVNFIDCNIKFLKIDMFDSVALGIRNSIKGNGYFLVMEDLMNCEKYPTMEKNSKLWPNTTVVDFDKLFAKNKNLSFGVPEMMNDIQLKSFITQILIRKVFLIGDFATRNFLRIGDKVYNVDTDKILVSSSLKMKKSSKDIIVEFYDKNISHFHEILEEWLNVDWEAIAIILKVDANLLVKNINDIIENGLD